MLAAQQESISLSIAAGTPGGYFFI